MWEFLSNVLEHAGFLALVYAVTLGGLAFTVRTLWARLAKKEEEKSALIEAFAKERADLQKLLVEVAQERRSDAAAYAEKLELAAKRVDDLQEKRIAEGQEIVREVTTLTHEMNRSVEKITGAMTTLERVVMRD